MPVTTFSASEVRSGGLNFPRVRLENAGDHARLACMQPGPAYEWSHRLETPTFSPVTGAPIMKTIQDGKRAGEQVHAMEWLNSPVCFGDDEVLKARGVDIENCPVCENANSPHFQAPQRRFAIHVFQYNLRVGTQVVASPFSGSIKIWVLSEKRFAEVTQKMMEREIEDVRLLDFILGPCTNVNYQNYAIGLGSEWVLGASEANKAWAAQAFAENHVEDDVLAQYCGKRAERQWVETDIRVIKDAWAHVAQFEQGGAAVNIPMPDVAAQLNNRLLDTDAAPAAQPAPASAVSVEGLDEFVSPAPQPVPQDAVPAAAPAAQAQPAAAPAATPAGETVSFSDMLNQLNSPAG